MTSPAGRERRWRMGFFVLGTVYLGFLLIEYLVRIFGAFSQIFLIMFLAWLLAFILAPLVGFLSQRAGLARGVSVGVVYAGASVAGGFLLFYSATSIGTQVGELNANFPETRLRIVATLLSWQEAVSFGRFQPDLVNLFHDAEEKLSAVGSNLLSAVPGVTIAVLGALVLIIILSLYMVADSDRILSKFNRIIPNRYEAEAEIFERTVARAFGGFLRAQVLLAAIQAIITLVFVIVAGLPYGFLIVGISALAMLIPFFGPPLALVPPVIATAIYAPGLFLIVAPVLLVAQTVIVNYLQPRLMREALGMHPLLVLVGLLVGAQVAGVWGALFGIPIIAVGNVFFTYAVNLRTLEDTPEVDIDALLEEVRRDLPAASTEAVVALAAERAEEAHEEAAADSAGATDEVATELRESTEALEAATGELRRSVPESPAAE